jgi:VRR-NUC domain
MPESKRSRSVNSLCRELKLEPLEIELSKSDGGWYFSREFFRRPEDAVFRYFQRQGYYGNACEGGAIQTVIKACCLDLLVAINTFHSEEDACNRYLEAQFTIHWDESAEIVRAVIAADKDTVARNTARIFEAGFVHRAFNNDVRQDACLGIWQALVATGTLEQTTIKLTSNPYDYRAGWPDLTLYREDQLLLVEVKTAGDKFHESQLRILQDFIIPLSIPFNVAKVVAT